MLTGYSQVECKGRGMLTGFRKAVGKCLDSMYLWASAVPAGECLVFLHAAFRLEAGKCWTACACQPQSGAGECRNRPCSQTLAGYQENSIHDFLPQRRNREALQSLVPSGLSKCHESVSYPSLLTYARSFVESTTMASASASITGNLLNWPLPFLLMTPD